MKIKERIFMGAGEHSLARRGHLHRQLERAFDMMCLAQKKLPNTSSKEQKIAWEESCEEAEYDIKDIAKEIYLALTGRKIK